MRGSRASAFLLSTLQEERYQKDKAYFEEAARKLGLAPFTLAADNDNARQLNEVEDALARGAKVLVIQPTDSAAAGAYVWKAHEDGVQGRRLRPRHQVGRRRLLRRARQLPRRRPAGRGRRRATGGKGNFVILNGQSGHSVAMEIARGYYSVLQPLIDAGAVTSSSRRATTRGRPSRRCRTVEDAIAKTRGNIAAILANNSGMARGAVQAVQAGKLEHVFIAGADADAANVDYVCEGKQSVEVLKEIKPLAEKAAEVAAELVRTGLAPGRGDGKTPVAAVAVSLVDAHNARALVIDSGFQSASSLPSCK